jgi:hypothetical protein
MLTGAALGAQSFDSTSAVLCVRQRKNHICSPFVTAYRHLIPIHLHDFLFNFNTLLGVRDGLLMSKPHTTSSSDRFLSGFGWQSGWQVTLLMAENRDFSAAYCLHRSGS